jgi:hypothetical protein
LVGACFIIIIEHGKKLTDVIASETGGELKDFLLEILKV